MSCIKVKCQQQEENIIEYEDQPYEEDGEEEQEQRFEPPEPARPERSLRNRENLRRHARYDANLAEFGIPTTYEEALSGHGAPNWVEAIDR